MLSLGDRRLFPIRNDTDEIAASRLSAIGHINVTRGISSVSIVQDCIFGASNPDFKLGRSDVI